MKAHIKVQIVQLYAFSKPLILKTKQNLISSLWHYSCKKKFAEFVYNFFQVGVFDPYSDDPRLAVKKIVFCQRTGLVAIGGTAGQVVIINLEEEDRNEAVKVTVAFARFAHFINLEAVL